MAKNQFFLVITPIFSLSRVFFCKNWPFSFSALCSPMKKNGKNKKICLFSILLWWWQKIWMIFAIFILAIFFSTESKVQKMKKSQFLQKNKRESEKNGCYYQKKSIFCHFCEIFGNFFLQKNGRFSVTSCWNPKIFNHW